ncbi:MAG: glycoside hydrolase family 36 protein, partial [Acutalibacteraceae bacterium]|nr:glycoside hydrolase family 36 protein [Acutalibacteraceae bacterium]
MKKIYTVKYKYNDRVITSHDKENDVYSLDIQESGNRYTVTLNPKKNFELVEFYAEMPYEFKNSDRFFGNGYQSWTKTREYHADEIMRGVIKLSNISEYTKGIARKTGDEWMIKYSEKPGEFHSHCYTYIRNGESMKLWGSLTEKNGFTYFKVKMKENRFYFCKDLEGKKVTEPLQVFDIVYFEGGYEEVFDNYFSMWDMPETRGGMMSGYTSWYNYFQKIDENIILRDLDGLDPYQDQVSIYQIDDGYETYIGDWLDDNPSKFPHGMKYIADKIHDKGYKAGIWLAPFNCQKISRMAKEHPDWLIKDTNGKPMVGCIAWGGAYTFDIYNEEVRKYLRKVFDVVLNEWGYDMVKLDFLYSQCIKPRHGKSRGEIMCDAMAFLRECVGDKLILGCGVPIGAAIGVVDACRISCDVDLTYKGKFYSRIQVANEMLNARSAINNSIFRRHMNGRVWMNDPDVFFLRKDNLKFTDEQKYLLGRINNLCGNVLFVSDNAGDYDENAQKLLRVLFEKTDEKIISAEYT